MGTERKPPQSAEELLRRYAAGEREFAGANLAGANLTGATLGHAYRLGVPAHGANLAAVNLGNANLAGANLIGAALGRANLAGAVLTDADLTGANLCYASFAHANLTGADLSRADLLYANLTGANLGRAHLIGALFHYANLTGADLSLANLSDADLIGADLTGTNLGRAHLFNAHITGATLTGADLGGATLSETHLLNVDLSPLYDADPPVVHEGPSTVDFRTILKSIRLPSLKEFLQRTGMPEVFVEYMMDCARSLTPGGVFRMLQSTFISYGGPDTDFAQKLNDALLKNGVATFFFTKDAIPGKKLHRLMREGVNEHDRVILICSQASLDRPGVLNEITETLQREARDGGKEYLIPITLDDYVFSGWKPEDPGVAQAIKDRVVADFRGADADPAKFNAGLLRLIAALKR